MDKIKFVFSETNEEVVFAILASTQYEERSYLLVVDENDLESEDMTAYILKDVDIVDEEVIYDIVDDDEELELISEKFDEILEEFEIEE